MPVILADLESELISRCGWRIDYAKIPPPGTSCFTDASPRPYLAGALVAGAAWVKLTLANPLKVQVADLPGLPDSAVPALLDVAELRLLRTIQRNWYRVNVTSGTDRQDLTTFGAMLQKDIEDTATDLKLRYGYGVGRLGAGRISLGAPSSRSEF